MPDRSSLPQWQDLITHQAALSSFSLVEAFATDPGRAEEFSLDACNIYFDYSKQRITSGTIDKLIALANACDLRNAMDALYNGEYVNTTEQRQALHWLLRAKACDTALPQLQSYIEEQAQTNARIEHVATQILNGQLRGYTGKPFTDIVNIGIGGSDLGPAMVYMALPQFHQAGIQCHYVANICGNDLLETLNKLNPHTTLFIIASKSFTTLETLTNADSAKVWLLESLIDQEAVASHFFAVSSKPDLAEKWGINTRYVFPFCDWVGGRYSLWSSIGLSLCIGLGPAHFRRLLAGAREMDRHFIQSDFRENLPVMLALIGIWNNNFWHWPQLAVIPYDHRLRRLPAFLQQLEMESTGKSCNLNGQQISYASCPTIWGEAGCNSQHSFFQLLHQGSPITPIDFIAVIDGGHHLQHHQDWLFTSCLAQSRAMMTGQTVQNDALAEHKFMPGNKPSSTFVLQNLTPESLGSLIALYEHKVYVQSVIWQVNAFDQWGVELGKKIGNSIKEALADSSIATKFDSSTQQLLARYKSAQK